MRYVAVYQCETPSLVGPIRSVRWVDWHLLEVFKHVELAFVAGINPNRTTSPRCRSSTTPTPSSTLSPTSRTPIAQSPDSTYASAATLWHLFGYHAAPKADLRLHDRTTAEGRGTRKGLRDQLLRGN